MLNLSSFDLYLLIVNLLGAAAALLGHHFRVRSGRAIDPLLWLLTLAGGSAGVLLVLVLCSRRVLTKRDEPLMFSRLFALCLLVIDLCIVLCVKGFCRTPLSLTFWTLFDQYPALKWYLMAVNLLTLIVYGRDKVNAAEQRPSRVPIFVLLGLALIGGSVGALVGMYAFRHKTRKPYFRFGVPVMLIMQLVVLLFAANLRV